MDNWNLGYRKSPRFLLRHPLHPCQQKREFTEWEAMNDLADMAAGTEREISVGGKPYRLPRGALHVTIRGLRRRWRWRSTDRVKKYLRERINEGSLATISKLSNRSGLILLVIFYDSSTRLQAKRLSIPNQGELSLSGHPNDRQGKGLAFGAGHGAVTKSVAKSVGLTGDSKEVSPSHRSPNRSPNRSHKERKIKEGKGGDPYPDIGSPDFGNTFEQILEHWNAVTRQDQIGTDDKKILIARLLRTFDVRHLLQAIDGALRDPWITGKKDGQSRVLFNLIFRDEETVEEYRAKMPAKISQESALEEPESEEIDFGGPGRELFRLRAQVLNHTITPDQYRERATKLIDKLKIEGEAAKALLKV